MRSEKRMKQRKQNKNRTNPPKIKQIKFRIEKHKNSHKEKQSPKTNQRSQEIHPKKSKIKANFNKKKISQI